MADRKECLERKLFKFGTTKQNEQQKVTSSAQKMQQSEDR